MEFQQDELNEILNIFQQESSEIISSMDDKLLVLEHDNKNKELAMQLFRDAHSLKGSARMLGFEDIQNLAHKIEDVISLVREDKLIITVEIADTISNCLDFILDLINKTVAQKEEFKDPEINNYILKLEKIVNNPPQIKDKEEIQPDSDKAKIISKLDKIEEFTINILFNVSYSRKHKEFNKIHDILNDIKGFFDLTYDVENIDFIKESAQKIIETIELFKNSENKEFSFLEVNASITAFIEALSNYLDSEHIKRKDYYDIVDKKIESAPIKKADVVVDDKIEEILQKVPLMEINPEFSKETSDLLMKAIESEHNSSNKKIYSIIKEITDIFSDKKTPMTHDITLGIKDALLALRHKNTDLINEAVDKIDVIKTMAKFQFAEHKKPKESNNEISSQKDILTTITNTEIKTLRVDSIKLDNLVGQIGELIVSKIKTNEQLSLAKKIDNDLHEWQKNFTKMNHYIKHFDKKFLSTSNEVLDEGDFDYRKFVAYNKQLSSLAQAQSDKISSLIKEMDNLFKQLQESETKLNSTTNEIESMVKNMRILPLSTIFALFPRMVHNIARDKGKKIELVIEGADITADKTIIEEIKIPLMHIIRNAIDHGIEDPKTRANINKNPQGRIEIAANYIDNKLIIDVKDDGRGLDIEKIKAKALEKKLLTEDELKALNDDELTNLIFYPGFSTEDFVTELSGRGLGLDIVNNKINQMQGRIDIFSRLNKGTVVRIVLPAAVATKKVFVIEEQKELFAIETSVIKTILRVNSDEIFEKDNKNYYIYDDNAIAVYTLSQILDFENIAREANKYTLLIIETESSMFGIIVEKLISDQEIVHKKLAPPLYKVKNVSGITTLANGEACLILNVADIISTVNQAKTGTKIITKNGIVSSQDNYKYRILIVDDSHTTRILQKNILSKYGYNISSATDPIRALEKLKQNSYDLIISDVQMPEMNGFEFIKELRQIPRYENCPVVVMSSEDENKYQKEINETKIIKYIQKNTFKQEEFVKTIESILNY